MPIGYTGDEAICPAPPPAVVTPAECKVSVAYAPSAPEAPVVTTTTGCDLAGAQIALLAAALWAALQR